MAATAPIPVFDLASFVPAELRKLADPQKDRESGLQGKFTEPAADLRFADFAASLIGKAAEYKKAKELEGH